MVMALFLDRASHTIMVIQVLEEAMDLLARVKVMDLVMAKGMEMETVMDLVMETDLVMAMGMEMAKDLVMAKD